MQVYVAESNGSDLAAWVQAVGSIIAIGVAIWIPVHERRASRRHEIATQTTALIAIGDRIFKTVERIHRRAADVFIERRELPWLLDEAEATSRLADSVNLTEIKDGSLIPIFMELQEAARTTSRRLSQDRARLSADDNQLQVEPDRFKDPYTRASRWLQALRDRSPSAKIRPVGTPALNSKSTQITDVERNPEGR
jgi:hypothetical protein